MPSASNSPVYDDITTLVAVSFLDFAPGELVERDRLLDHVKTWMVRNVRHLGLLPPQDDAGAEKRAIKKLVVRDALSKVQRLVGFETRTIDGIECYCFGPLPELESSTTPTINGTTTPVVDQPPAFSDPIEKAEPLSANEDTGTATNHLPPAGQDADNHLDQIYRGALLRRTLTDDQRAALAAEWVEQKAARPQQQHAYHGFPSGGREQTTMVPPGSSMAVPDSSAPHELVTPASSLRAQAAQQFRVSERKVKRQQKLRKDHPELAAEVRQGSKTLWQARCEAQKQREKTGLSHRQVIDVSAPTPWYSAPSSCIATDAILVLTLVGPSPEALLDGLADNLGLEPTLHLLRATLQLGQNRQARKIPTLPSDDNVQVTDREFMPELTI